MVMSVIKENGLKNPHNEYKFKFIYYYGPKNALPFQKP